MKKFFHSLAFAAVAAVLCSTARALPQLWLSSNGTTWTLVATDGAAGDVNGAAGQVTFVGSFGSFNLNVHTGTTFPAIGTLANPQLDLSFNATSATAGTIYIAFTANGFGPTNGTPVASVGGTAPAGSTVTYTSYGGNSNVLLDLSLVRTTQGPFTGSFGSTTTGAPINNAGPYSLSQVVQITAGAGGIITTGDALLTVPDSGTSLAFLGAGLMGLGFVARLRSRFS